MLTPDRLRPGPEAGRPMLPTPSRGKLQMNEMAGSPRVGGWIQTFLGGRFYPLDPRPDEVFIMDIAHALSNLCRYGGHVRSFLSVAQHSVYVSRECDPRDALWGLLHDAGEAYLVDVPSPLKRSFPEYGAWEAKIMVAVCSRFGLPREMPPSVKRADDAVLAAEANALMSPLDPSWKHRIDTIEPSALPVVPCWSPRVAELEFMARFHELSRLPSAKWAARGPGVAGGDRPAAKAEGSE